jgi:hypothetical protein
LEKEYQTKIIDEIKKSGFPLELEIVEILRANNILTFPNVSFQGGDGNVHELDIIAIIFNEANEWKHGSCGIQLLVECKKTDKYPWVFFDEGYNPLHAAFGRLYNADYSTDFITGDKKFNPLVGCMNTVLNQHHYNDLTIPRVRSYFEAFKKPNEQTTIYKAVTNIFYGRQHLKEWFEASKKDDKKGGRTFLNHYTIVLDGPLLLSTKIKDEFKVEEVNHVSLITIDTQEKNSGKLLHNEITIDVIKKDFFPVYLKMLKKEAKIFNQHLKKLKI